MRIEARVWNGNLLSIFHSQYLLSIFDLLSSKYQMRNYKDPLTYALYLLELRDRSVGEIIEKMQRKGFDKKAITEVVDFLLKKNFLDDKKFAEKFVKEKQELQHWGQYRIKTELFKKHIPNEIIDEIMTCKSEDSEIESAREAADLWRRKNPNCPKQKVYSRLGGFLSRRGFSYDVVKEILDSK